MRVAILVRPGRQAACIDTIGGSTPYKTTLLETNVRAQHDRRDEGRRRSKTYRHFDGGHRREQGSSAFLAPVPADADVSTRIDQRQDHDGKKGHRLDARGSSSPWE